MAKKRVHIKSLPYAGRYGHYRANAIFELDEEEAKELVDAGHADYTEAKGAQTPEEKDPLIKAEEERLKELSRDQNRVEAVKAAQPKVETAAVTPKPETKAVKEEGKKDK